MRVVVNVVGVLGEMHNHVRTQMSVLRLLHPSVHCRVELTIIAGSEPGGVAVG